MWPESSLGVAENTHGCGRNHPWLWPESCLAVAGARDAGTGSVGQNCASEIGTDDGTAKSKKEREKKDRQTDTYIHINVENV